MQRIANDLRTKTYKPEKLTSQQYISTIIHQAYLKLHAGILLSYPKYI